MGEQRREKRVVRIVPNIGYYTDPSIHYGTFCIEEDWPGGTFRTRGPFSTREQAECRAKEIAQVEGYEPVIEHVLNSLFPDYSWLAKALDHVPLDSNLMRILNARGWHQAVPFTRADTDTDRASRAQQAEGR